MKYEKIVICPAKKDKKGKIVITEFTQPPYGYHRVLGVYPDGTYWVLATVDVSIDVERVVESVKCFMAVMLPIEIGEIPK